MLLDLITLITFRQQYSSWRSSLCSLLYSLGTSPSYAQYRPILENPHRGNVPRDNMNSADTETGHFPHILATAIRKDLLYTTSTISWSLCVVTSCWRRHSRRTRNVGNTAVIYTIQDVASYPESGAVSMYLSGSVLYMMWRYIKEVALYQRGGSVSKKWCCTKEVAPYTEGSAIRRGWRHIKEVAVYQRGGTIWRGGAISMRWRRMKGVGPYLGSGVISRRWRHMKGWRHIREVALYQGDGAISRKWHYIQEVALYPGVGILSRRNSASLTDCSSYYLSPPPLPVRLTISPAPHHSVNTQYYQCGPEANRRTSSL